MADWAFNGVDGWSQGPNGGYFQFQGPYGWTPAAQGFFQAPAGFSWYEVPGATGGGQTWQQMGIPVNNTDTPGINFRNATGGTGLEPGYNYIFPDEHCKVHVLKCATPPWQLQESEQVPFNAHMVPTMVTIKSLMQNFGCDNEDPSKNVMHEVVQAGNGKWYRGLVISGDQEDRCAMRVGEMGWGSQDGGEVVWLYFTKD